MVETEINIRWMLRKDLSVVYALDRECFEHYWSLDHFEKSLRVPSLTSLVAEYVDHETDQRLIVAFMVYVICSDHFEIVRIAVRRDLRRRGFAAKLLQRIDRRLDVYTRTFVTASVDECNFEAQQFLKAQGFVCTKLEHGLTGSAYRFSRHAGSSAHIARLVAERFRIGSSSC